MHLNLLTFYQEFFHMISISQLSDFLMRIFSYTKFLVLKEPVDIIIKCYKYLHNFIKDLLRVISSYLFIDFRIYELYDKTKIYEYLIESSTC